MIGGKRELEKGAAPEDDETDTVTRRSGQRPEHRTLGNRQSGDPARTIHGVHRAGEVQQHQQVAPGVDQRRGPLAKLWACHGEQSETQRAKRQCLPDHTHPPRRNGRGACQKAGLPEVVEPDSSPSMVPKQGPHCQR